jgi:HEAT repeat protein
MTAADHPDPLDRRRAVVLAGLTDDRRTVDAGRTDDDGAVRAAAVGALARRGRLHGEVLVAAIDDRSPLVRRRVAEVLATWAAADAETARCADSLLLRLLSDADDAVVELAAHSVGERHGTTDREGEPTAPTQPAMPGLLTALRATATDHGDPLCREAAIAALGAAGDEGGRSIVIDATAGEKPAIRRRAVVALAAFDGPDIDSALRRALDDRDWQVREAAEALLDPDA